MRKQRKRSLAAVLAFVMILSLIPAAAFAANAADLLSVSFLTLEVEEAKSISGFVMKFSGEQEDPATEDFADIKVELDGEAVEVELAIISADEEPKDDEGNPVENQSHFAVMFVEPFTKTGTYKLTGKFKDKEIAAEIEFEGVEDDTPMGVPSDWAKEHIDNLLDKNIIPKALLADFQAEITREQFTALLWGLYVYAAGDIEELPAYTFEDIEDSDYKEAIIKASSVSIIAGESDTVFNPSATLDRQQLATMLCNVLIALEEVARDDVQIGIITATGFADDADVAPWAKAFVEYCRANDILAGEGENRFAPTKTLNCETAMAAVNKLVLAYNWGDTETEPEE